MEISVSRGVYLPRPAKVSAGDNRSTQYSNSTPGVKAGARPQLGLPVSVEGGSQQNVASAYAEIRTQQIRGYMPERLPCSPSVRGGLAEYNDLGGHGQRDELEALGVNFYG